MLIINMDYCGTCRGTCPTCVLSQEEKESVLPLLTCRDIQCALEGVPHVCDSLVLGVGRANNLVLPEECLGDYSKIAQLALEKISCQDAMMEISTSLIGRIEPQIERAKAILASMQDVMDVRFVVVGNTTLASEPYWENLQRFFSAMQEWRGGENGCETDGMGDIMVLNVTSTCLPEVSSIVEVVRKCRFPINVVWVPSHDGGIHSGEKLSQLEDWMLDFYAMSIKLGLDCNLVNWLNDALALQIDDVMDMKEGVEVYFIAPKESLDKTQSSQSSLYRGSISLMGDFDPRRFQADISSEEVIQTLMRNPTCRSCHHYALCHLTGASKNAALVLGRYPHGTKGVCPNGMRKTFQYAKSRSR